MKQERKDQILQAALRVAERPGGWNTLTRLAVAQEAGVSEALPSVYFGTMKNFRRAIMREAIRAGNYKVLAQGVVNHDPVAMKAPADARQAALATLIA